MICDLMVQCPSNGWKASVEPAENKTEEDEEQPSKRSGPAGLRRRGGEERREEGAAALLSGRAEHQSSRPDPTAPLPGQGSPGWIRGQTRISGNFYGSRGVTTEPFAAVPGPISELNVHSPPSPQNADRG
ncbi:unnamed protein product [Gadus morhua 'NCC']